MTTAYFTFGQNHAHRVNGKTFDRDTVVKITSADPRQTMVDHFGLKWAFQYDDLTKLKLEFYPKGIITLGAKETKLRESEIDLNTVEL